MSFSLYFSWIWTSFDYGGESILRFWRLKSWFFLIDARIFIHVLTWGTFFFRTWVLRGWKLRYKTGERPYSKGSHYRLWLWRQRILVVWAHYMGRFPSICGNNPLLWSAFLYLWRKLMPKEISSIIPWPDFSVSLFVCGVDVKEGWPRLTLATVAWPSSPLISWLFRAERCPCLLLMCQF